MKSKVLVTGGAGFIGSHVARHLADSGYEVVVLDDMSGGYIENVPANCNFVKGSVQDARLVSDLFAEHKFEYVFHLAAYAAEGLSHFIKNFNYQNNLIGSINLINAAVNSGTVKCFVFTSSIAVYGANQTPMVESLTPMPEDPYGISKYAVELDLEESLRMFGLNYVIFRPHNVYGPNQNIMDPYRNVIGIFIKQCLQNKPLTIFGDGSQLRAFSHIDNVAPIIAKSIEFPSTWNTVYNVGSDTPVSVLTLAKTICKKFGIDESQISFLEARNEVLNAYSDHSKLRNAFSSIVKPDIPIEEGISEMIDWVKTTTHFKTSKKFDGIEVWKNMPPSWKKQYSSN